MPAASLPIHLGHDSFPVHPWVSLPTSSVVMYWVYVIMIQGWGSAGHNIAEFGGTNPLSTTADAIRFSVTTLTGVLCMYVCARRGREAFGNFVSIRACVHLGNRSLSGPRTNIMSCRPKCAWMWIRNQTCHKLCFKHRPEHTNANLVHTPVSYGLASYIRAPPVLPSAAAASNQLLLDP